MAFEIFTVVLSLLLSFIETGFGAVCLYGPDIKYVDRNSVTGKFYKIHDQLGNSQEGKEMCESEGGRLLMIKDMHDFDFIKDYYPVTGTSKNSVKLTRILHSKEHPAEG